MNKIKPGVLCKLNLNFSEKHRIIVFGLNDKFIGFIKNHEIFMSLNYESQIFGFKMQDFWKILFKDKIGKIRTSIFSDPNDHVEFKILNNEERIECW